MALTESGELGEDWGGKSKSEKENVGGGVIALSYCGASLPGLALPLRKFLQTKIYTDTKCAGVQDAFQPALVSPAKSRRADGRGNEREGASALIFLVSIKTRRLGAVTEKIIFARSRQQPFGPRSSLPVSLVRASVRGETAGNDGS